MNSVELDPAGGFDATRAEDLAAVLDALPSLVAYIDSSGVNRYANAAAERWLRRPLDTIVGALK